jgi:hypothetical protein
MSCRCSQSASSGTEARYCARLLWCFHWDLVPADKTATVGSDTQVLASIQIKRLALVQVCPLLCHPLVVLSCCLSGSIQGCAEPKLSSTLTQSSFSLRVLTALQMNQTLDYSFENTPVSNQQANGSQVTTGCLQAQSIPCKNTPKHEWGCNRRHLGVDHKLPEGISCDLYTGPDHRQCRGSPSLTGACRPTWMGPWPGAARPSSR